MECLGIPQKELRSVTEVSGLCTTMGKSFAMTGQLNVVFMLSD